MGSLIQMIAACIGAMAAFKAGMLVEQSNLAFRSGGDSMTSGLSGIGLMIVASFLIVIPIAVKALDRSR